MSIYAGPNTIQSGLVLHIDPNNPRCYPGSGSTVFDLSGQGNNGVLTNGASVSYSNGGVINFDGTDDYISVDNIPYVTTQYTLSTWARLASIRNYHVLFYRGNSTSGDIEVYSSIALQSITAAHNRNNGGSFFYAANNNSTPGSPNIGSWGAFATNTFFYFSLVYNSNTWRLYINGYQIGRTVTSVSNPSSVSSNWRIGGTPNTATFSTTNEWQGVLSDIRIYNRPLSGIEILQNYHATKGRYGL